MMKTILVLAAGLLTAGCSTAPAPAPVAEKPAAVGSIVRLDPAFDALVPKNAQIEKLAGGFTFTEGPLWRPQGVLWFSDVVGNVVRQWSPDGKVTNAKFIAAGQKKVKLDAPKGSGIADGIFYVTDIKVVRKFDLKTGAPKGDIAIAGATFLNDIAVGPGGKVYVSDSGVKGKADGGMEPTGTDAVYVIEKGKVKPVAKSKDLGGPNGLLWTDKGLIVVGIGGNEAYRLDDKGAKQDVTKLPAGGLDGLAAFGDSLLITSWQASAIFKGKMGDKFEVAFPDLKGAADIGIDTKRSRLLVPRLLDSAIEIYELK